MGDSTVGIFRSPQLDPPSTPTLTYALIEMIGNNNYIVWVFFKDTVSWCNIFDIEYLYQCSIYLILHHLQCNVKQVIRVKKLVGLLPHALELLGCLS